MTLVSQDNGLQLKEQCLQYKLSGTTMIRKALIKNHSMQNQQDICTIPTWPLFMRVNFPVSLLFVKFFK